MGDFDAEQHLTVGQLRDHLVGLPDDMPVIVHVGWDFPLLADEDKPYVHDGELVMFLDHEDCAMVTRTWLESVRGPDA